MLKRLRLPQNLKNHIPASTGFLSCIHDCNSFLAGFANKICGFALRMTRCSDVNQRPNITVLSRASQLIKMHFPYHSWEVAERSNSRPNRSCRWTCVTLPGAVLLERTPKLNQKNLKGMAAARWPARRIRARVYNQVRAESSGLRLRRPDPGPSAGV